MSISNIATAINEAHAGAESAKREGARLAIECGRLLTEAKGLVAHGAWDAWVQENCAFSIRTAQLYMKAFRFVGDDPAKTNRVADLSLREIGRLADQAKEVKAIAPADQSDDRATPSQVMVAIFAHIGGLPGVLSLLRSAELNGKTFKSISKSMGEIIAERPEIKIEHFESLISDVIDKANPQEVKEFIYDTLCN